MIEEIVFGNIPRVYGTLNNHLSSHGTSVNDFNQIHEILLCLKTANKLGVIWGAIIHLHVLPVEEEDGGGDVADVKVSRVDRSFVHIDDVDRRHVAEVVGGF